jgi:hypothetical protein
MSWSNEADEAARASIKEAADRQAREEAARAAREAEARGEIEPDEVRRIADDMDLFAGRTPPHDEIADIVAGIEAEEEEE